MVMLGKLRIFLDDLWVRFKTHTEDESAHHTKYTDAEVDAIVATHTAIASAHHIKTINAAELTEGEINDARIPGGIARDTELTSAISDHAGLPSVHHTKYSDSDAVTAIEAEAELDLKLFTSITMLRARVFDSEVQTVPTGIWTTLTWDTAHYNISPGPSPLWHSITNPSRFTVKYPGTYIVHGTVRYPSNATGCRMAGVLLNGGTYEVYSVVVPNASCSVTVCVTTVLELSEDDYIELQAYQSSGGDLNVFAGVRHTGFAAAKLY